MLYQIFMGGKPNSVLETNGQSHFAKTKFILGRVSACLEYQCLVAMTHESLVVAAKKIKLGNTQDIFVQRMSIDMGVCVDLVGCRLQNESMVDALLFVYVTTCQLHNKK